VVSVLLALSAQNERLEAQVAELTARVARQDERIATLERELGRSSRNSSQPPSADRPSAPPGRGKDPSGRRRATGDHGDGVQGRSCRRPARGASRRAAELPCAACRDVGVERVRASRAAPRRWQTGREARCRRQVLSARLGRIAHRPHPVAGSAAAQIARCPERSRIAELSRTLGVSARRLEQVLRTEVGLRTSEMARGPCAHTSSGTAACSPSLRARSRLWYISTYLGGE
jgi:hypothetical protein